MIKDIVIKIPLVDQRKHTKSKKWAGKSCAICSVKMLMTFDNGEHIDVPVMTLVNEARKMGGYLKGIGWRHHSLVKLAENYGLKLNFVKKFFKTEREKFKGLKIIEKNILKGKPVAVSLFYKLNPKKGGHVVVINGLKKKEELVLGYHIQDPDSKFRGNNYFLDKKEFTAGWRGGMIYLAK